MYARPFFLTLRVDNLPEIRKQKEACAHLDATVWDLERHKKEKLFPIFPLDEMQRAS
jgi:hypothetical protein